MSGAALKSPASDEQRATNSACSVAVAYVAEMLAEKHSLPLVFSDEGSNDAQDLTRLRWAHDFITGRPGKYPPIPLLKALEGRDSVSAVAACPDLRRLLDERGIPFGAAAVKAAQTDPKSSVISMSYSANIISISLPAVNRKGTGAVLIESGYSGALAGGGYVHYLVKGRHRQWHRVSLAMAWIS